MVLSLGVQRVACQVVFLVFEGVADRCVLEQELGNVLLVALALEELLERVLLLFGSSVDIDNPKSNAYNNYIGYNLKWGTS